MIYKYEIQCARINVSGLITAFSNENNTFTTVNMIMNIDLTNSELV